MQINAPQFQIDAIQWFLNSAVYAGNKSQKYI